MKKVAFYVRVSTDDQENENQLIKLRELASRNDWNVTQIFRDDGVSGAKDETKRQGYADLRKAIQRHEFDLLVCWSIDRISRSTRDLVLFLDLLNENKVDLYSVQQGIDTTSPYSRAIFQICGIFAEMERTLISSRTKAGLERAKQQGSILGRKSVPDNHIAYFKTLRNVKKYTIKQISIETGYSVGVISKYLNSKKEEMFIQ
jgi:DNA invertase Pin-like site-specific DNA recombinase